MNATVLELVKKTKKRLSRDLANDPGCRKYLRECCKEFRMHVTGTKIINLRRNVTKEIVATWNPYESELFFPATGLTVRADDVICVCAEVHKQAKRLGLGSNEKSTV